MTDIEKLERLKKFIRKEIVNLTDMIEFLMHNPSKGDTAVVTTHTTKFLKYVSQRETAQIIYEYLNNLDLMEEPKHE